MPADRVAVIEQQPAAPETGRVAEQALPARGPLPPPLPALIGVAAGCIVIAGAREISNILGPVTLALILVITFHPVRTWLTRHRCPGWLATAVTILALAAVLVAIGGSLTFAIAQLINTLPNYGSEFSELYAQSIYLLSKLGISTDQIVTALRRIDPQSFFGYLQTALSSISGLGSLMAMLVVTMLFFTIDAADMPRRLEGMAAAKPDLVAALRSFAFRLRRYWVVSTVFGVICAILDVIALAWLNVPMAITFGVLAFVTNYIPNIGFVIGLVPPALMALLAEGPRAALWVVVVYCVINFVVQTLIQPRFTGDAVGLTASMTFLSLLFWAWVLGALGALLAVPLTLFFKAVVVDRDPAARWFNTFLSSTGE